jgi:hypothetical protein
LHEGSHSYVRYVTFGVLVIALGIANTGVAENLMVFKYCYIENCQVFFAASCVLPFGTKGTWHFNALFQFVKYMDILRYYWNTCLKLNENS